MMDMLELMEDQELFMPLVLVETVATVVHWLQEQLEAQAVVVDTNLVEQMVVEAVELVVLEVLY
jgi:hypothetical protein